MTTPRRREEHQRWTVGVDAVPYAPTTRTSTRRAVRRLHAVSGDGLIEGRAVCMVPVVLLDPGAWRWPLPEDTGATVCWICRALTA